MKPVIYADYNRFQLSVGHVSGCSCVCCMSVCECVCVRAAGGMAGASAGSYLCVTGRGTMQRIDAKPTATLQGYSAFYSPHSSKKAKDLSLPPSPSVSPFSLYSVECSTF